MLASSNHLLAAKQIKTRFGGFFVDYFSKTVNVELTNINKVMNKYETWYRQIIQRAKTRTLATYTERHHIVPRSLSGSDDKDNLVDLTAKEHFICHWLLIKMHTGTNRGKMINALYMMQGQSARQKRYTSKITGRIYEHLRKEYAEYIRQQNTGNQITIEQREKIRQSKLGKSRPAFSEKWKENLSENHKSKKSGFIGTLSEDTRKKISEKAKGRKQSAETIAKKADAVRGSKREKLLCPHCAQHISVNTYPRWHGNNCKQKDNQP